MLERRPEFESGTTPRLTGSLDGKYNYLPLGSRKPCLHVKSWWPNLEWRMHNSNSLTFMAEFLEQKLEQLEGLMALEDAKAYKLYNETIRELKSYCIHYLHVLDAGRYDEEGGTTKLDRHRVNLCRDEIEDILKMIKINGELVNNRYMRIAMTHAYKYLGRMKKLKEDVIKQTLDPFWDQTLILPPRTVHGTKEYIKLHPPNVVLQAFDQDICGTKEFCGRCTAIPLVKLAAETYSPPDFPPKLKWYKFKSQRDCSGSILAAFELIEVEDDETVDRTISSSLLDVVYNIPEDIRPKMASYRLEVIFWGVRDMKKINYLPVLKPRIIIECAGVDVKSEVMENAKKFGNFVEPHILVDLSINFPKDMPELSIYYPSVTIKAYDSRGFGCFKYAGICIIPSVYVFLEQLITEEDYDARIHETKSILKPSWTKKQSTTILSLPIDYDPSMDENRELIPYKKMAGKDLSSRLRKILLSVKKLFARFLGRKKRRTRMEVRGGNEDESLDWWSKYFASLEVYDGELELQPQFAGFQDRLRTFELWKGRKAENPDYDSENYVGKFKGRICVYRWPHPDNLPCKTRSGRPAVNGLCDDYPSSEPVRLLVRLYVVNGINLQPKDPLSGKSDPYLCIKLGKTYVNDRKNYIPNQLNPMFGRLFEIEATFPQDHTLIAQVWDYDATSSDDLIGETKIDLENRFYSGHRATCGISRTYNAEGYNYWRDREKPTLILDNLCKRNNLPSPDYREDHVKIGRKRFRYVDVYLKDEADREECMALNVLHQWQDFPICGCALVPEHVERRPLFNAAKPGLEQVIKKNDFVHLVNAEYVNRGIRLLLLSRKSDAMNPVHESNALAATKIFTSLFWKHDMHPRSMFQGKLELWVDMFQFDELPPKPAVDISPPVPEEYEIRVIVWNTEDVPLVDSQFLTGEKCSDIYVKGYVRKWLRRGLYARIDSSWILYDDYQKTDVHYNSLNGEGNFNWRFVFRVTYSKGERVMIVRRKVSVFARSEIEDKLPCKLHLQVWDSDHFSPDDFLGKRALTLDLSRMPRGSGNSKNCTMKILDPNAPTTDLFKCVHVTSQHSLTLQMYQIISEIHVQIQGKIELEMAVLTAEEADEHPAGKGRNPPQDLPPPNRPDTSFSWFRNPWKACRFVVCRYYKWRIICFFVCLLFVLLCACGIYAFPGYMVKRLLGA
ncbi:otoferlin-like [Hylaeus anthracinus]|uniref:otoferlin-like n=1 Tax=Hylaeus anthracinus TaxID=313031 RepID=UPI0023BA110A|nr:otoferlin-like [Hylaeus anthracinus]